MVYYFVTICEATQIEDENLTAGEQDSRYVKEICYKHQ